MPLKHVETSAKGSAILKSPLFTDTDARGVKSLKDPVGVVVMLVGDMVIGNREPTQGR